MNSKNPSRIPRQLDPELELIDRSSASVIYLEHGFPSNLVRWHYHEEFELHLIVASSGKMFVGDYIGSFQPFNLVLTGPFLPHNWITGSQYKTSIPLRDRVIQFHQKTFDQSYRTFPETREIESLLAKAQYGIEFFGAETENIEEDFIRIRDSLGLERMAHFFRLLNKLNRWTEYRLLNTLRIRSFVNEDILEKVNTVLNFLSENYAEQLSLEKVAGRLHMNPSYFSRFFHKATGSKFFDFINRLRVSRACDLLLRSDKQISEICYEVGYNNLSNFNRQFRKLKNLSPKEYRHDITERYFKKNPPTTQQKQ